MREVIKIAFRRENINVIACHDGASALAQMENLRPGVVISDVIMPDQDGYQVCEQIKQHPQLANTPVILMSGVVNRAVAERSFAVKADELIRKPFEPQDLISRVKRLLGSLVQAAPPAAAISANAALSSIFATPASPIAPSTRVVPAVGSSATFFAPTAARGPLMAVPTAASTRVAELRPGPAMVSPRPAAAAAFSPSAPPPPGASLPPPAQGLAPPRPAPRSGNGLDAQKLRIEILRLQGLVRKLQSELQAERDYVTALEAHIKTLQEVE
jgi:CheY-like chemotaxis protein